MLKDDEGKKEVAKILTNMTPTQPNVSLNGRYTISEAAEALQVTRQTVLLWAKAEQIKYHQAKGRKRFKGRDIIYCWQLMTN